MIDLFPPEAWIVALVIAGIYATLVEMFKQHFWKITVTFAICCMLWLLFVTAFAISMDIITNPYTL